MRNLNYFFLTLSFSSLILFVASCSKNETKNFDQTDFQSQMNIDPESRIIAFRESINAVRNNLNLKSGNISFAPDEAEWFVEALINYTYANASFEQTEFVIDSAIIVVPVSEGAILLAEVQSFYDQTIEKLSYQHSEIITEYKQLCLQISIYATSTQIQQFLPLLQVLE